MGVSPSSSKHADADAKHTIPAVSPPPCSHRSRSVLFVCTDCAGDPTVCNICSSRHLGHSLYTIEGLADVASALRRHLSELCDETLPLDHGAGLPSAPPSIVCSQTLQRTVEVSLSAQVTVVSAHLAAVAGHLAGALAQLDDAVASLEAGSEAADAAPAAASALSACLDAAASRTAASLEAELVALDVALEAVRVEFGAVRAAADALAGDDAGLVRAHGVLVDRLWEGAYARARATMRELRALPPEAVAACVAVRCRPGLPPEAWSVGPITACITHTPALEAAVLGARWGGGGAGATVGSVPAGGRVEVVVALTRERPDEDSEDALLRGRDGWAPALTVEERATMWSILARSLRLHVSLRGEGGGSVPPLTPFCISRTNAVGAVAVLAVDVPASARPGSVLVVERVEAWGGAVPAARSASPLPVALRVVRRPAPLRAPSEPSLAGAAFLLGTAPCVSADGRLFAPVPGMAEMRVGAAPPHSGADASLLLLEDFGLSRFTCSSAFDDGDGERRPALLLADVRGAGAVALEPAVAAAAVAAADDAAAVPQPPDAAWTVRWRYTTGSPDGTCAVAVLPRLGVAAVSALPANAVHLVRVSDGTRVASIDVQQPTGLAVDAATSTLYVSCRARDSAQGTHLCAWRCRWRASAEEAAAAGDDEGGVAPPADVLELTMIPPASLQAAGLGSDRPIAIVPAPRRTWAAHAHLVVADEMSGCRLRVLALPAHRLVHEEALPAGARIVGLAADAAGTALVVCDLGAQAVRVLPWPLPGPGAAAIAMEGPRG